MPKISLELTGMFPRAEALVAATRDFDRQRITEAQLKDTLHKQQSEVLQLQKKINAPLLSDGMLNWQDIFRPFSVFCRGIEPGTLTRFADTNTFFRQPRVTGDLQYTGSRLNDYFSGIKIKGTWKATLPAPFFFARVADDRYCASITKLTFAFTEVLAKLINELSGYAYKSFQLFDPYLGYLGADSRELNLIQETTKKLIGLTKASISYQTAFACPPRAVKMLTQTGVRAIGLDFFNTDMKNIPTFQEKIGLVAGCLDSRSSLVEDPKTIATFLEEVIRQVEPREVVATSNIDLQYVPVNIAQKKLFNLQKAVALVAKKYD